MASHIMFKKVLISVLLVFSISIFNASQSRCEEPSGQDQADKLIILNWSEYFDPEVLEDFQKETGIQIVEIYFETDEIRNEMMVKTSGKGYDIVIVDGITIAKYAKQQWLEPISEKEVANLKHVDPKWRNAFSESAKYAVPFMWGTTGIAYRKDKLSKPVTSWMDLFKPEASLQGKIVMIKYYRDLIGMSLKALGYSINETSGKRLDEAKDLLLKQKPFVKAYSYVSLDEKSTFVTGETLMAPVYNGDALMVKEHEPAIEYVVPKEGCNLWCDFFVVPRSSTKKKLAYKFLNFINEPEIMARQAQFSYYATTNKAAEKLLPKDFLNDPIIYPPKEILLKSETYSHLPPRVEKKYNTIFNQVIR